MTSPSSSDREAGGAGRRSRGIGESCVHVEFDRASHSILLGEIESEGGSAPRTTAVGEREEDEVLAVVGGTHELVRSVDGDDTASFGKAVAEAELEIEINGRSADSGRNDLLGSSPSCFSDISSSSDGDRRISVLSCSRQHQCWFRQPQLRQY